MQAGGASSPTCPAKCDSAPAKQNPGPCDARLLLERGAMTQKWSPARRQTGMDQFHVRNHKSDCRQNQERLARLLQFWPLPSQRNHESDETPVRSLCGRMVCTECGMIGADLRPDWSPHVNKQRV
jgi:hypothetical protein